MEPDFQIQIEDRGEEISYRQAGREFHFEIFLGKRPYKLYADKYWDGTTPPTPKVLSEDEKKQIVPRLVAFMKQKEQDARVIVKWERDPVTQPKTWRRDEIDKPTKN